MYLSKVAFQGSSIGCYPATDPETFETYIKKAFGFGPYVLIEKKIKAREIEVSTFEYKNQLMISKPGEVLVDNNFYNYEAKYSTNSKIKPLSPKINNDDIRMIKEYSEKIFRGLNLRHLSRIDYFINQDNGEILLNEINTFPGMTLYHFFPNYLKQQIYN